MNSDVLFTRGQLNVVRLIWMAIALILALMTIFPLFWMISIAFKTSTEVFQPSMLPKAPNLDNFLYVLTEVPFIRYLETPLSSPGW